MLYIFIRFYKLQLSKWDFYNLINLNLLYRYYVDILKTLQICDRNI